MIAWRRASSKAPSVCSPPWTWTIGTRSTVAASAAAAVSSRSPTSSSASTGVARSCAPTAARAAAAWASAGGSAAVRRASANSASGSKPSARIWSMVWPCRSDRCVPPTHSRESRSGWARIATQVAVQDAPVLAAGRQDGDRPRRARCRGHPPRLHVVGADHRAGRPSRAGRSRRRGRAAAPARVRSRVAGRRDRPPPTVAPAARSVAQCRLRRATAAIARSAATGTFSPVPRAAVTRPDRRRPSARTRRAPARRDGPVPASSGRGSGASR